MSDPNLEHIVINANAYIFVNDGGIQLSNSRIKNLFQKVSAEKVGRYLLRSVNEVVEIDGDEITYSTCVFTRRSPLLLMSKSNIGMKLNSHTFWWLI